MTNTFDDVKVKIAEFQAQLKAFEEQKKKLILDIGQKPFHQAFLSLQEQVPCITKVHWNQYTPHWNDGEACTFGVDDWKYDVEIDGEVHESEDTYDNFFRNLKTDAEIKKLEKQLKKSQDEYDDMMKVYKEHAPKSSNKYSNVQWSYKGKNMWGAPSDSFSYQFTELENAKKIKAMFPPDELVKIQKAIEDFKQLMSSVPEELYEGIFGDHATISITEEGVEVEEFEHD